MLSVRAWSEALPQISILMIALTMFGCASNGDEADSEGGAAVERASAPLEPEPDTDLLLLQAAQALEAGRLTRPRGDNAAALYRQVLHREPGNAEAVRGSQRVVRKLILQGLETARSGDYRGAEIHLTRAQQVDFGHPGISNARAQIRDWFATSVREYPLDPQAVAARLPQVLLTIEDAARLMAETNGHFEIRVAADADGLWIYQQLVQAAGDHPLRGRILVSREPELRIIYRRY